MANAQLKFSPSHSERWLVCTGSVQLSAPLPEPKSSKYAAEGTAAHEVAANCLKMNQDASEWVGEVIEVEDQQFTVTEKMAEHIQVYLDAIRSDMAREGVPLSELHVEVQFDIPGIGKGTNDAYFSSPMGKLYAYDLKYGEGTYVEVVDNTQLKIYSIGALLDSGGVNDIVRVTIVQPRYIQEGVNVVRSWEIPVPELMKFKAFVLQQIAEAKGNQAKLVPGKHCKWCKAFGVCPEVAKRAVQVVDPRIDALVFPEPSKMTPEQIVKVLKISGLIDDWAGAVKAYAERQAIDLGVTFPGYKLIRKQGRRAWIDELQVENEFEHEFGDAIYEKKVKSPAQMEKLVGKERVKPLTEIPDKGLELVLETAKGEAVQSNLGNVFQVLD